MCDVCGHSNPISLGVSGAQRVHVSTHASRRAQRPGLWFMVLSKPTSEPLRGKTGLMCWRAWGTRPCIERKDRNISLIVGGPSPFPTARGQPLGDLFNFGYPAAFLTRPAFSSIFAWPGLQTLLPSCVCLFHGQRFKGLALLVQIPHVLHMWLRTTLTFLCLTSHPSSMKCSASPNSIREVTQDWGITPSRALCWWRDGGGGRRKRWLTQRNQRLRIKFQYYNREVEEMFLGVGEGSSFSH